MPTKLDITVDELIRKLIELSKRGHRISILDSCGVGHLGSHLMIAGVDPVETSILGGDVHESAHGLERLLSRDLAAMFTISYDFGAKLKGIRSRHGTDEPDIYIALFDSVLVHDYGTGRTSVSGKKKGINDVFSISELPKRNGLARPAAGSINSNFSRQQYLETVEKIKELIRDGDTYQTNLTQKLTVPLRAADDAGDLFLRLRRDHPAPFSSFIDRGDSQVVSASPERFFKITDTTITASPIKGTRPRGENEKEDVELRDELLSSGKDRAENTMIVDLLRNDLGRVCRYGSVAVKSLCDLEEHPTLFHLVSTVEGKLRQGVRFGEILEALFPCGSITGAPKIRTMQIIDELEPAARGLSMGAIGYFIPDKGFDGLRPGFDLSVAIRTMVVKGGFATFNVGGGITIDSDAPAEYDESMLKAKALLSALEKR